MGILKVLGGVAAGIGVIVAAPVFGAVGTITTAGILVGATVGAVGSVVMSKKESDIEESFRKGYQEGKAESAADIKSMELILAKVELRLKDYQEKEKLLIAMFAVGVAAAHCDGVFSAAEKANLQQFLAGVWSDHLPEHIKLEVDKLYQNPPTFNEAMVYINEVGQEHTDLFDTIIELMIHSDDVVPESKTAFGQAWNSYKAV